MTRGILLSGNGARVVGGERFCTSCGAPADPDGRFCGFCGHDLGSGVGDGAPAAGGAHVSSAEAPTEALRTFGAVPGESPGAQVKRRRLAIPKRVAIAAGLVGALVAAVVAAVLVLDPFDDSDDRVRAELRSTAAGIAQISRSGAKAQTLAAVAAVGNRAERALGELDASIRDLEADDVDESLRAPARAALSAERDLLAAYVRLAELRPQRLDGWAAIDRDMSDARLALLRHGAAVERLELGAGLIPSPTRLERAQRTLDATLVSAEHKLRAWRRRYEAARRRQQTQLGALGSYESSMSGQLDSYLGLRTELDGWLDQFGSEAVPFGQAEGYLSDALSQRQQVVNQMASLNPPTSVAASHFAVQGIVEQSLRAMDNAIDGARECTEDPFCLGEDFRQTADWQEFIAGSEQINSRLGSVRSQWEAALARATRSVQQRRLPPPPKV